MRQSAASTLEPVVRRLLGGHLPVRVRFWDGSALGPADVEVEVADASVPDPPPPDDPTIVVRSPDALRHMLWAPGELGFGRAYVAGHLDIEGDIYRALDLRQLMGGRLDNVEVKLDARGVADLGAAVVRLGMVGRPPALPVEEARLRGRLHSKSRDEAAIRHHYDVGNDFYRTLLGPTMTYSCAYWADTDPATTFTLEDAQTAKFELICRKLALAPGDRLLDVGCGWGSMLIHAARHHGVTGVGITLAKEQMALARQRVAEAGLSDRIEIRFQDYRDVHDGPYDAISSIGMFEHVGLRGQTAYFTNLYRLLRPRGRLLNHAISRPDTRGGRLPPRSFVARYVFPDGELREVGTVVTAMQDLGFEVRDVESLREHYARTLRAWVANLETNQDALTQQVGAGRVRVWRLYLAASAVGFEANRIAIHQVLGVKPDDEGRSGVAATRSYLNVDHPLPTSRVRVS